MKHVVSLLLVFIFLSGCASSNLQSRTYIKPGEDLTQMKRYTWAGKDSLSFLGVLFGSDHQALAASLKLQTTKALSSQGYQYVDADENPQFRLSIVAGAMVQIAQTESKFGSGTIHLDSGIAGASNKEYFQGGLSLAFMDLSGQNVLWQGTATQRIKHRDMGRQDDKILNKLLGVIMATLPSSAS